MVIAIRLTLPINNLGKKILEDHINKCIVDVVGEEQLEEKQKLLEDLNDAIDKFVR